MIMEPSKVVPKREYRFTRLLETLALVVLLLNKGLNNTRLLLSWPNVVSGPNTPF